VESNRGLCGGGYFGGFCVTAKATVSMSGKVTASFILFVIPWYGFLPHFSYIFG